MMARAKGIGMALLGGFLVSVGCSSSNSPDDQASSGSAGVSGSTMGGAGGSGGGGSGRSNGGEAGETGAAGMEPGPAGAPGESSGGASAENAGAPSSSSGAGGEAGSSACPGCMGGLCLPSGQCVACLPTNDSCPSGQYCGAAYTCVAGCKGAADCASGVCEANHDCQSCISDQECSAGEVCGDNHCAAPCTTAQQGGNAGCGVGLTCCSLHCVDTNSESADCGTCGTACGANGFCGLSSCRGTTLSSVCSIGKVVVVLDGQPGDEGPGRAMAAALVAQCTPAPTEREVSQDVADVSNISTGQPVSGGDELLVVAGGYYFERVSKYDEAQPVAPIYAQQDGATSEYVSRASGQIVVSFPGAEDTSHYFFVVQFMRDPVSGSLILNAQGYFPTATAIAASYFSGQLLPMLGALTKSWYVYQWTDANADLTAQPSEITLFASAP